MTTETRTHAERTAGEDAEIDGDDALRTFVLFVAGTFASSWGFWALPLLGIVPSSSMGIIARVGGFGPLVGALVLPPFLVGIAGVVHVVVFGASVDLDAINPLWVYPIAVVVVFLVGGGQEELGPRAFALPGASGTVLGGHSQSGRWHHLGALASPALPDSR